MAPLQEQEARLWSFRGHLPDQHLAAAVEVGVLGKLGQEFLNLHLLAVAVDQVPVWLPLTAPAAHPAVPVVQVGPVVAGCQLLLEHKVRLPASAAPLQEAEFLQIGSQENHKNS